MTSSGAGQGVFELGQLWRVLLQRKVGTAKAAEALHLLEQLPIELVAVDLPLVREAAERGK
jgi:hypothetical protein